MNILVVNDDGYQAEGINTLKRVLTQKGNNVYMIAPQSQRSGASHAITIAKPIAIEKIDEKTYSCSGFPADCVMAYTKGAVKLDKIDLVVSGINMGFNISSDVIYSGTDGAAAEAAMDGLKSIAISCEVVDGIKPPYEEAALFLANNLEKLMSVCAENCYVNINVPAYSNGEWGVCGLGTLKYYDTYFETENKNTLILKGVASPSQVDTSVDEVDFDFVNAQRISISVIEYKPQVNLKMHEKLKKLDLVKSFC